jgi:glutathione synthase/RimK-type ligase-like ATP-grasp enzyme
MLWGLVTDAPLACVHQELVRLGAPVVLLNQRNVLSTGLRLQIGESVDATMTLGGRRIELAEVGAVYLRPHDTGGLPHLRHLPPASPLRAQAAAFDEALSTWLEVTDAFVVTRPSCAASNGSKPYQSRKAAAAGFAVPETLVTTDPAEALAFVEQHEHVVYKSVSAVRSRVRRMDARDRERLPAVARTPTQFQRYVPGTDVRVHVVGSQMFAAEVSCDADDYRYAAAQGGLAPVVQSVALPTDVAERCLRLCQDLNLPVAGIDLRRTPEDIWVCFEVNPSPAFTYYAQRTAQPIGAAIAARLAAAAYVASSRSKQPQRAHSAPGVRSPPSGQPKTPARP